MNRARTAYSIARTGHAVIRGEHLLASNDDTCPDEGRGCEGCRQASVAAIRGLWHAICDAWPLYAVLGLWTVLALVFGA